MLSGHRTAFAVRCIFVISLQDVGDFLPLGFIGVGGSQAAKLNC